jgi:membrane protein DedA with SNARE-associated domain
MTTFFEHILAEMMQLIESIDPLFSYILLGLASFVENIFPPAPGDVITIFGASLIASGHLTYTGVLISTTVGSVAGFMLYYYLGLKLGKAFFLSGRFSFLSEKSVAKTEQWFDRYGYKLILVNRFLSGLRSVISIFCGISRLSALKVFITCTTSALVWNIILITAGATLGENWDLVKTYLADYGKVIILVMLVGGLIWFLRSRHNKKKMI